MRRAFASGLLVSMAVLGTMSAQAAGGIEVHWTELVEWNTTIVLDAGASPTAIEAVRDLLAHSDSIVTFALVTPFDAIAREQLIGRAEPATHSVFRVSFERNAQDDLEQALQLLSGVRSIARGSFKDPLLDTCRNLGPGDTGILNIEVGQNVDVGRLREYLDASPHIDGYLFMDPAAVLEVLHRRNPDIEFRDDPTTAPSFVVAMPTSFLAALQAERELRFIPNVWGAFPITPYPPWTCSRLANLRAA